MGWSLVTTSGSCNSILHRVFFGRRGLNYVPKSSPGELVAKDLVNTKNWIFSSTGLTRSSVLGSQNSLTVLSPALVTWRRGGRRREEADNGKCNKPG